MKGYFIRAFKITKLNFIIALVSVLAYPIHTEISHLFVEGDLNSSRIVFLLATISSTNGYSEKLKCLLTISHLILHQITL